MQLNLPDFKFPIYEIWFTFLLQITFKYENLGDLIVAKRTLSKDPFDCYY